MATVSQKPRGILNPALGKKNFHLTLTPPAPDLASFIEYYWIIEWDLRGEAPFVSENLPHPCVHLVFEPDYAYVYGVVNGKFVYQLEGEGRVFGVKFKPAAFYPFCHTPIANLTNKRLSLSTTFGMDCASFEAHMHSLTETSARVDCMEQFLRARQPEMDDAIALINAMVDCIRDERTIKRVDDLLPLFNLSKRTLQRLFNQYVGVHPKWVIQRYRLVDAVDLLALGERVDWSALAQELGYFDQAHFIKDFKALIGKTPAEYVRQITA
ncbi:MAG: helix-turn-helix domain-containing protein [Aggregatilineales bacterium]